MKRFIFKILISISPVIIILMWMEFQFQRIPNDYKYKKEYLDSHSSEIETLILGSSYSYYGIDPLFFPKNTFNAAYSAQFLYFDFEILKKYQNNFEKLEYLVLPVSPIQLYTKRIENLAISHADKYATYYDIEIEGLSHNSLVSIKNIFRLREVLHSIISHYVFDKPAITCSELGWGTNFNSEHIIDLEKSGKETAIFHTSLTVGIDKESEISEYNLQILTSIIEWCRIRNVKLFLFTPPAFETYRNSINSARTNKALITFSEIASKYENCCYENMYSDPEFIDNDFFDSDHLCEIGAKKLSVRINKKIIEWN